MTLKQKEIIMKIFERLDYATVTRPGYDDSRLVYIKKWKILGVTIFKLTFDTNHKWINPLI